LYSATRVEDAKKLFKTLKLAPTSPEIRFALYHPLPEEFRGEIVRLEATYCFIARDGMGDWIYAYRDNIGQLWSKLTVRQRVVFRIAFSFSGPSAFDVHLE